MLWVNLILIAFLVGGCSSTPKPASLSYEAQMKRAETALREDRLFEAKKWTAQALQEKPDEPKAQTLMARLIEREVIQEKSANPFSAPEETTPDEKAQDIKTWLERSRGFLEANQFEEALWSAEQIFLLDPENRDASRLIDQIKERARKQGHDETIFLQELYEQEVSARIQNYLHQAEASIQEKKWGAARFAIEKVLVLDPQNGKAKGLLVVLNKREKVA